MSVAPRAAQVLADLGVAVCHRDASSVLEREALEIGTADNSSHWLAGAKPSRLMSEMPLITVWLILTTPRSPGRACVSVPVIFVRRSAQAKITPESGRLTEKRSNARTEGHN